MKSKINDRINPDESEGVEEKTTDEEDDIAISLRPIAYPLEFMHDLPLSVILRPEIRPGNGNTAFSLPLPGQWVEPERRKDTRSLSEAKRHHENPKANKPKSNG